MTADDATSRLRQQVEAGEEEDQHFWLRSSLVEAHQESLLAPSESSSPHRCSCADDYRSSPRRASDGSATTSSVSPHDPLFASLLTPSSSLRQQDLCIDLHRRHQARSVPLHDLGGELSPPPPIDAVLIPHPQFNLINIFVSLMGYYLAALTVDNKFYGRKMMQQVGFFFDFIFFVSSPCFPGC